MLLPVLNNSFYSNPYYQYYPYLNYYNGINFQSNPTDKLEHISQQDTVEKKGMSVGGKFALGTIATVGAAALIDLAFNKGRCCDSLLKIFKKESVESADDIARGVRNSADDITEDVAPVVQNNADDIIEQNADDIQKQVDDYFQEEANRAQQIAESDARNQAWLDDVHRRNEQEYSDFWNNALDEEARILKPELDKIMNNFNTVQHQLNDIKTRIANGEKVSAEELAKCLKEYRIIKESMLNHNSRASVQGYFDNIGFDDFSDLESRLSNYRISNSIINNFDSNYRALFEHFQEYCELPQWTSGMLHSVNDATRLFEKPILKEEQLLREQVQAIIDRGFKPSEALRQEMSELDFRGTDLKDFEDEINRIIQNLFQ